MAKERMNQAQQALLFIRKIEEGHFGCTSRYNLPDKRAMRRLRRAYKREYAKYKHLRIEKLLKEE